MVAWDESVGGYQGRNFVLPPLGKGQGRFLDEIVVGDQKQAEDYLQREHIMPVVPRIRRKHEQYKVYTEDGPPAHVDTTKPWKVGNGPVVASSSVELQLWPAYSYDVNGYYAILGTHSRATKRELREAYQRVLEKGKNLVRATYCFKQLLNPEIRRAYDATPVNETFLDEWEVRRIKAEAKREAIKRRLDRGLDASDSDVIDAESFKVLDERGWHIPDQNVADDAIDSRPKRVEASEWQYASYRWKSTSHDKKLLALWQQRIIRALAAKNQRLPIVVGYHRDTHHEWKVSPVGDHLVAFLRDTSFPTEEMAARCANVLISIHTKRQAK